MFVREQQRLPGLNWAGRHDYARWFNHHGDMFIDIHDSESKERVGQIDCNYSQEIQLAMSLGTIASLKGDVHKKLFLDTVEEIESPKEMRLDLRVATSKLWLLDKINRATYSDSFATNNHAGTTIYYEIGNKYFEVYPHYDPDGADGMPIDCNDIPTIVELITREDPRIHDDYFKPARAVYNAIQSCRTS